MKIRENFCFCYLLTRRTPVYFISNKKFYKWNKSLEKRARSEFLVYIYLYIVSLIADIRATGVYFIYNCFFESLFVCLFLMIIEWEYAKYKHHVNILWRITLKSSIQVQSVSALFWNIFIVVPYSVIIRLKSRKMFLFRMWYDEDWSGSMSLYMLTGQH